MPAIIINLSDIVSTIVENTCLKISTSTESYEIPFSQGNATNIIAPETPTSERRLLITGNGIEFYIESNNQTLLNNYRNSINNLFPQGSGNSGQVQIPITEGIVTANNSSGSTIAIAENLNRKFLAIQNTQSGNLYFSVTTGIDATADSFVLIGNGASVFYDNVVPTGDVKFYVVSGNRTVKFQYG